MKIEVTLTEAQEAKFNEFMKVQGEITRQKQEAEDVESGSRRSRSLYGFGGSGHTWHITHCGIGLSITVTHHVTGAELDLTDIESW